MEKKESSRTLPADLDLLRVRLPTDSEFSFEIERDSVYLKMLSIPLDQRGVGTKFLAEILAITDRHGFSTWMHADATDEPGDPSTFDLARWYSRFGFSMVSVDDDFWLEMRREAKPYRYGAESILEDYASARLDDLSHDEFTAIIEAMMAERHERQP